MNSEAEELTQSPEVSQLSEYLPIIRNTMKYERLIIRLQDYLVICEQVIPTVNLSIEEFTELEHFYPGEAEITNSLSTMKEKRDILLREVPVIYKAMKSFSDRCQIDRAFYSGLLSGLTSNGSFLRVTDLKCEYFNEYAYLIFITKNLQLNLFFEEEISLFLEVVRHKSPELSEFLKNLDSNPEINMRSFFEKIPENFS